MSKTNMAEEVKMVERKPSPPLPLPRKIMILTTTAILLGNITFGCTLNSFNPAVESLRSKYNISIEEISVCFTIVPFLYSIGGIFCGFVAKYVNRQLIAIASLLGLAFVMFAMPHCPTKDLFFVMAGMLGFFCGFYDSSQMVWMIEMWQEKSGPLIQAQHFSYALGTMLPALIIAPFLNSKEEVGSSSNTTASLSALHSRVADTSRIHIPFTILSAFNTLALALQIFLFTFYRYHTPPMYANEDFKTINDANKMVSQMEVDVADKSKPENVTIMGIRLRKLKLIAMTGMFLGAYCGMEVSTLQFLSLFGQYSDLKITETASAYVLTGFTAAFAIGRGIGIVIIFKVRPEVIICMNFVLVVAANFILLIFANNNLTLLWVGSILLGFGYSTVFPSFCAFIEKYLVFTNLVSSFIVVVSTTTASMYPLILGKIMEENAVALTYTNFFSTSVCTIAMIWGYKMTRNCRNRER